MPGPLTSNLIALDALLGVGRAVPADPERVRRLQERRLRRLVGHAYERVPYYRRLFEAQGLDPRDVRTLDDLRHVPVTTRAALQALDAGEVVARGVDPARLNNYATSGSTGRPMSIRRSWLEDRVLAAVRLREMHALGLRRGDRVAVVKTLAARHTAAGGLVARALSRLGGEGWHAVDCMLEPVDLARRLCEVRPDVVTGYPAHLSRLAHEASREALRALGVRVVWTGGEVLTDDQRTAISDAFGAPVYDTYASYEFDLMARECPHAGGYHVCDDAVLIEVVRDGHPVGVGERGEVVATALCSLAMPFVRYSLGDIVERGPATCACGAAASTVRAIQGRIVDFFTLPDGRIVHPYGVFIPIRTRSPWMLHYQVRQTAVDRVVMKVVPKSPPDAAALALVRDMARDALGAGVRFELDIVDEIASDPSGKFQTYRSAVPLGTTGAR